MARVCGSMVRVCAGRSHRLSSLSRHDFRSAGIVRLPTAPANRCRPVATAGTGGQQRRRERPRRSSFMDPPADDQLLGQSVFRWSWPLKVFRECHAPLGMPFPQCFSMRPTDNSVLPRMVGSTSVTAAVGRFRRRAVHLVPDIASVIAGHRSSVILLRRQSAIRAANPMGRSDPSCGVAQQELSIT